MSRRQYANKKDANQPDIEKALLRIGAQYIDTSDLKKDGFDLLVLFRGQAFIVEVKNPDILPKYFFTLDAEGKRERLKKTLTDKERGAMKKCEETGNKYIITYSADHWAISFKSERLNIALCLFRSTDFCNTLIRRSKWSRRLERQIIIRFFLRALCGRCGGLCRSFPH